ncbi:hypothetical protein VH567_15710 [Sphingomonas sp. 4RDLI-65]|uniref:hypothetical protein n=1 Tax=Sphingomonas sp. 4RDLI-65 TaxID=3111641 RepID=UPI003C2658C0
MTPAAEQACRFVQLVAQAQPHPGNALDERIVTTAQKIAAEIRRELFETSRSDVPLTRKA